ncbi:MAG: DnaJ domain-containing protein [Planctomycetia bacterium]|nr:DnaJ domain-containing protein [Planctomycetia bacterium]
MEFKDYYQILGVADTAPQDEIKRVYRQLARKYHPDVSKEPKADARFKEVTEAYEALSDKEKRVAYDHLRQSGYHQGDEFKPHRIGKRNRGLATGFSAEDRADFSDFFSSILVEDLKQDRAVAGKISTVQMTYSGRHLRRNHLAISRCLPGRRSVSSTRAGSSA